MTEELLINYKRIFDEGFAAWGISQLNNNEFLIGLIGAGLLGFLFYSLRQVPNLIYQRLKLFFTIEVTYNSDFQSYYQANTYIFQNVVLKMFSRRFIFSPKGFDFYDYALEDGEFSAPKGASDMFQVGYGITVGSYKGIFLFVNRQREKDDTSREFKESTTITFLTRNREKVETLFEEILQESNKDGNKLKIYNSGDKDISHWSYFGTKEKRSLDSVISRKKNVIKERLKWFCNNEEFYKQRSIPYHFGILLYGLPGTGKSSLIHSICSEFNRDIYYLDISSVGNEGFIKKLHSVSKNGILVIEDIDSQNSTHKREDNKGESIIRVNLSTILNSLDGVIAPDGLIVIATTNHLEKLDKALIRPGRFDHVVEMEYFNWEEFVVFYERFYNENRTVQKLKNIYEPVVSPAKVQEIFMSNDKEQSVKIIEEILRSDKESNEGQND